MHFTIPRGIPFSCPFDNGTEPDVLSFSGIRERLKCVVGSCLCVCVRVWEPYKMSYPFSTWDVPASDVTVKCLIFIIRAAASASMHEHWRFGY